MDKYNYKFALFDKRTIKGSLKIDMNIGVFDEYLKQEFKNLKSENEMKLLIIKYLTITTALKLEEGELKKSLFSTYINILKGFSKKELPRFINFRYQEIENYIE